MRAPHPPPGSYSHHTWSTSGCHPGLLSRHFPEPSSWEKAIRAQIAARLGRGSPQAPGVSRTPEGPCACPPLPPAPLKMLFTGLGLSVACLGSPGPAVDGWARVLGSRSSPGPGHGPGAHLRGQTVNRADAGGREQPGAAHGPPFPSGKAQAPDPSPALPSCTATLCHLREAGEYQLSSHVWLGQPQGQVVWCVHQEGVG